MITVLLADDEPIIIKGLKKLISWEDRGIEIIGEAWTGRGLLEEIETKRPALVITDISMPDGSGIDVLKEISRRGLRTKVIFISAYQEFSYAKEALALGAVDYLVKPIEKNLLLTAVNKALSALKEESEGISDKSKLAIYEFKDRKSQMEEVFDRLVEGDIRKKEASCKLDILEAVMLPLFTVILLEPKLPAGDPRWGEHEMRLLLFAMGNMAEEIVNRNASGILLRKGDRLCYVINHSPNTDILELAQAIQSSIEDYLKIKLSIGVGTNTGELEYIRHSYRNAMKALERVYFAANNVVAYSDDKGITSAQQQLRTIKEYIDNHYMENITLEGAASKIFMNSYYFSSFFKKHTQMNFKQYLTEVRMKQALKLLLQTDSMVYEIAEQVGYNNARQFSDMFKKFYGKLPQEYKAQSGSKKES